MKNYICLICFIISFCSLHSQTKVWEVDIKDDSSGISCGMSTIYQTKDNGYIASGYSYDFNLINFAIIVKLNENGKEEWRTKIFTDEVYWQIIPMDIIEKDNGDIIAACIKAKTIIQSPFICVFDKNGNILDTTDLSKEHQVLSNGGYKIFLDDFGGFTYFYISDDKYINMEKYSKDYELISKSIIDSLQDASNKLFISNNVFKYDDNEYIISENIESNNYMHLKNKVIIIDASGNIIKEKEIEKSSGGAVSCKRTSSNEFVTIEKMNIPQSVNIPTQILLTNYDSEFNYLSESLFGDYKADVCVEFAETHDKGFMLLINKKNNDKSVTELQMMKVSVDGYRQGDTVLSCDTFEYRPRNMITLNDGDFLVSSDIEDTSKYNPSLVYFKIIKFRDNTTDIKDDVHFNKNELLIFPNPASSSCALRFHSENETSAIISISDILGINLRKFTHSLSSGVNTINMNVEDLPTGLYFVKVFIAPDKVMYARFIR